jgi:hypothetical protein
MRSGAQIGVTLAILVAGGSQQMLADVKLDDAGRLTLTGDFRLRLEQDWDSQTSAGVEREDRLRARARARLSLGYALSDSVGFGVQVASGSDESQQSPHITILDFDDNSTGAANFNFDKWFVRVRQGDFEGWAGRNSVPVWKANELFLDDDVTPAGIGLRYTTAVGEKGKLGFNGGYFSPPAGMRAFAGNLALGQLVWSHEGAGGTGLTLAGGGFQFDADPADPSAILFRQGNGGRDYTIWVGNAQARRRVGGKPLTLGADFMTNSESYSALDPDPFTAANRDETEGYDVYVTWGGTGERGDWLFGVWYAHIEALAVNASFAQDDWVRWGSADQTDSSDFEGFELRAAVGLGQKQNLVARLYLVDAITSVQDGKRFRVDCNVSF